MRIVPISPACSLGLGMRVQVLEPGQDLFVKVSDVFSNPSPRWPDPVLPPLLESARRHLQQVGDLLLGHDLQVRVVHAQ
jgi:hypothetical protein